MSNKKNRVLIIFDYNPYGDLPNVTFFADPEVQVCFQDRTQTKPDNGLVTNEDLPDHFIDMEEREFMPEQVTVSPRTHVTKNCPARFTTEAPDGE